MQSAAGGTSQRLNPARAMMRSRSRSPAAEPMRPPASSMVVIGVLQLAALCGSVVLSGLLRLRSCLSQFLEGLAHERIEPSAPGLDMRDRGAHIGIPEFADAIGRPATAWSAPLLTKNGRSG